MRTYYSVTDITHYGKGVRMKKCVSIMGFVASMMAFGGCGTMFHGGSTLINITSVPKSNISIDGKKYGQSPLTVKLSNKKKHLLIMDEEGYRPYTMVINKELSLGGVIGDIALAGPVIGGALIMVDYSTGGLHYLSPDKINTKLVKIGLQKNLGKKLAENKATFVSVKSSK